MLLLGVGIAGPCAFALVGSARVVRNSTSGEARLVVGEGFCEPGPAPAKRWALNERQRAAR